MTDLCVSAAEHFDLITKPVWPGSVGPALSPALKQAGEGPVLDIGAGAGLGLSTIASVLPDHEIIAVEPSPSLRIGLFTRLADNPALAERGTVLPPTVEEAVLPSRLGAAVGINMLGHLNPAARTALWSCLAARLSPGAPAVFTLQPPSRPERIPEPRSVRPPSAACATAPPAPPTRRRTASIRAPRAIPRRQRRDSPITQDDLSIPGLMVDHERFGRGATLCRGIDDVSTLPLWRARRSCPRGPPGVRDRGCRLGR
jgi:hypothetical protein